MSITIKEFEDIGTDLASKYVNDWCAFAQDVFGVVLDPEQAAILRSCQVNKKTSVRSGTSRGKDFIAAVAALCFFYLTPSWGEDGEMVDNTKVALTAPTDRQIGDIMYPEVARLFERSRTRGFNLPGRLVGYGIRTDKKEWFLTGFKADDHNTEAWTGFHAVNTMFVVTEASGIPELVFNAIEGNLQNNSRLLIVFNDNNGTGYASNTQRSPSWAKYRLDSLQAPNVLQKKIIIPGQVNWEWVNDMVINHSNQINERDYLEEEGDFYWDDSDGTTRCYRPDDLFRVKVRGMAPKVGSDVLVPMEWIEAANKRWTLMQADKSTINMPGKHLRLGVDVAGMGRDSSTFCYRFKDYVDKFDSIHSGGTANHMEIAGKTKSILSRQVVSFAASMAFIDTIGEGAGVYSRLVEQGLKDKAISVKGSEKPEWRNKELTDITKQHEFYNMRAYLYWMIRDWLNPAHKNNAALPVDEQLAQELMETKWFFKSDGKIQIEPKEDIKKRIKRSPDKGDSLAMTFHPIPDNFERNEINRRRRLAAALGCL